MSKVKKSILCLFQNYNNNTGNYEIKPVQFSNKKFITNEPLELTYHDQKRSIDSNSLFHKFLDEFANLGGVETSVLRRVILGQRMEIIEDVINGVHYLNRESSANLCQKKYNELIEFLISFAVTELHVDVEPVLERYEKFYKGTGRSKI